MSANKTKRDTKTLDENQDIVQQRKNDPRKLVTKETAEIIVEKDFGPEVVLKSFEIKDFTKAGDGIVSFVTSLVCSVNVGEEPLMKSYVLKLNREINDVGMKEAINGVFVKEGEFLKFICSDLSEVLEGLRMPALRFPKCIHTTYDFDKEVMVLEDLRERNFKLIEKKVGMDVSHVTLVLRELARLHASGYILKKKLEEKNSSIEEKYPYMKNDLLVGTEELRSRFKVMLGGLIENSIQLLENVPGYEKCIKFLKKQQARSVQVWQEMRKDSPESFITVCHGDPWVSNIFFRYDESGNPIEVCLIDLQLCHVGSLASDLTYFLVCSTDGNMRSKHLDELLKIYHEMFQEVIGADATLAMPFTVKELREEYIKKIFFGALTTMFQLQHEFNEGQEEAPSLSDFMDKDKAEESLGKEMDMAVKLLDNLAFKSRFLAMFDNLEYFNLVN